MFCRPSRLSFFVIRLGKSQKMTDDAKASGSKKPSTWGAATILGRLSKEVREQNWFAVVLELLIVVVGVVIGFQVTAWGQSQEDRSRERTYLRQIVTDLAETERLIAAEDSIRYDTVIPSARRLIRSFGHEPKPPADSVLAWFPSAWRYGFLRPLLGTASALISSGNIDLIQDDSLRSAIVAYVDLNEELMEEQRLYRDNVEAAGQRISSRVDISEWVFTTTSDSTREARSRRPGYVGLYPVGNWSSPIPMDVDAFYADPTMYTSAWSLGIELKHIADTHRQMRESAVSLREHIDTEIRK